MQIKQSAIRYYTGTATIALAVAGLSLPAQAQFTQFQSAGLLSAGDTTLNYSGAGFVSSPFAQSAGGNTLTYSASSGPTLFLQTADGASFDFAAGTNLLETTAGGGADGPLVIDFSKGVTEFGLSAQNFAADTEAFSVTAYNGTTELGSFSTPTADNSSDFGKALFLGGSVAGGETITRLSISSVSSEPGAADDFLIGSTTFGSPAPVPEASTFISLALGLTVLGVGVIKTRKRTAVA